jgi:two-component system sensor histidine kinase/response regulator
MSSEHQNSESTFERHAAVLASALDAIVTIDSKGLIIEFNPSAARTFGWSAEEAVGRRLSELIIPERYRGAHERGMKHYAQSGEGPVLGSRIEIEALHREGNEFPIELAITPILTKEGTVFTAFIRDLTEAKKLNRELSIASFTIENSSDAIFWINENAQVINCNPSAASGLGYERDELVGKLVMDIDKTMDEDRWREHWGHLRSSGTIQLESWHTRADGSLFPVEVSANYIVHEGIELNCVSVRDVTLRKEAQRKIYESSQRLELVLEASEIGFWDWNICTNDKIVNKEYLELCGVTRDEYDPAPDWFKDRIHPDEFEEAQRRLLAHFAGELDRIDSQFRLRQPDGTWRWVHDRGRVVERDEDGKAIRAMGAMQDVTQRREATEALKISEQRFRDIVSSVGEFIWETDANLQIKFISDPIARILNRDPAVMIGESLATLTSKDQHAQLFQAFEKSIKTQSSIQNFVFPVDSVGDTKKWVCINAHPMYSDFNEHIGFRGTGLDITAERSAEQAKAFSHGFQRLSRSIAMELLEEGNLRDTINSIVHNLGQYLHADRAYMFQVDKHLTHVMCNANWFSEESRLSEKEFPLRGTGISPSMIHQDGTGSTISCERAKGTIPSWCQLDTEYHIGLPIFIEGEFVSYLGIDWVYQELTIFEIDFPVLMSIASSLGHAIERRNTKSELELSAMRLANEARRAEEASEAKSAFLAHMSHELRTPLTAVLGSSEILASGENSQERQRRLLESILSNGRLLLAQINSVLDLSRYEKGETPIRIEPVSVMEIITQVRSSVMPTALIQGVNVEFKITTRLPAQFMCDSFQLAQVLVNLITNSIKYSNSPGVQVEIGLGIDKTHEVVFEVVDQGIGIPLSLRDKLFEPFERGENSLAPGTGLGLAICKRIVDALGGMISCASIPDQETRFTCVVPLSPYGEGHIEPGVIDQNEDEVKPVIFNKKQLKDARVLLAEDSPQVQEVLTFFLSDMGAQVEHVKTGASAVEAVEQRGEEFNVILMDMQMPEMDGYTAATTLKEMGVTTPIIALTAHGLAEDREKCINAGCNDYLSKPVSPDLLSVAIRRAIGVESDEPTQQPSESQRTILPLSDLVERYRTHLRTESNGYSVQQKGREDLRRMMHQIKGTAATMGLSEISAVAAQAESALKAGKNDDVVEEHLRALRALIQQ